MSGPLLRALLPVVLVISLSACASMRPVTEEPPEEGLPTPEMVRAPGLSGHEGHAEDARAAAAHNLVLRGFQRLQARDYDGAVRLLERAVGIHPDNGPAYFYLAEAWLTKAHYDRAARFNDLATLYLRDDPAWRRRAASQKDRISRGIDHR